MIAVMNMKKITKGLSRSLSVPAELVEKIPVVTLRGKESLCIENHNGILSYGETCMMIACKREILCVKGRGLNIKSMGKIVLHLCGCIESIQWE